MKRLIILPGCAFIFLLFASFSARAEYYIVSPGTVYYTGYTYAAPAPTCCYKRCTTCCRPTSCCRSSCVTRVYYEAPVYYYDAPPVVYMHYSSPRRHVVHRGSEELAEYAWVPYP